MYCLREIHSILIEYRMNCECAEDTRMLVRGIQQDITSINTHIIIMEVFTSIMMIVLYMYTF